MAFSSPAALFVFGINPSRIGGIEVHTREVAERLGELGWRAILAFHKQPPEDVRRFLSLPNVDWDVMPNAWANTKQTASDLDSLIRRYRPRLLHLQFTPFLSPFPWIARLRGVRRIVFTDQASRPEGYTARAPAVWKRLAGRRINQPLSLVIAVSEYNRRALMESTLIAPDRVHRIYNGADLARASSQPGGDAFRRRHGIPMDRVLVTQVCWMIPEKGVADLLQAARLAIQQEPGLHFALIGEGKHRAEYTEQAIQLGIQDHVTWTGLVQDPMGEGAFAATDISCQASRWEEAFGFVIAEAMACGKPLVATRAGGIPEVVLDGTTGLLVERRNPAALAGRIVELARDPALRARLGEAGRERAHAQFDVRKNARALVDLYGIG
ncbi:MAG: glycosyltransferase family 4 protein [Acidobacteria bacterium]|nr:glycosyltransferase family 4 protein [Acidobacteriota bacterium]